MSTRTRSLRSEQSTAANSISGEEGSAGITVQKFERRTQLLKENASKVATRMERLEKEMKLESEITKRDMEKSNGNYSKYESL